MFKNLTFNLKRLSILAVATMVIGGFTGVAAHATAGNLFISTGYPGAGTTTATTVAGPANTISITCGNTPEFVSVTGGLFIGGLTSTPLLANSSTFVQTPTVGTVTVSGFIQTGVGVYSSTPTDTITITVVTALPGTVYSKSTIYAENGTNLAPSAATDAAFSVNAPSTASNVAEFSVQEFDPYGNVMLPAYAQPITVSASIGMIASYDVSSPTLIANTPAITAVPTTPISHFLLSGIPGFGGVSIITIAINGVYKIYKVTFTGNATKIVLTAINPVVGVGIASAMLPSALSATGITANTNALQVQEFDAAGTLIPVNTATLTINSISGAIAVAGAIEVNGNHSLGDIVGGTLSSATAAGISINGVTAGTATFVATDSSASISSLPITVRVSSGIPTSAAFTTDASLYLNGAPGTLKTTLSNATGTVPAGTYVVFTGQASSSLALSGGSSALPGAPSAIPSSAGSIPTVVGQITVGNDGTYTSAFNAPANDGTATISATPATAAITVTPVTFTVSSGNSAPEAANESTNADNAATAAATAAATSTDASDLALQNADAKVNAVTAVLAALPTQIASLQIKIKARAVLIAKLIKKKK